MAAEQELLVRTINKLLDKAGKDPRLTPRILREKMEQRMNLARGTLKPKREELKDLIYDWWVKNQNEDNKDGIKKELKPLIKLARVSGLVPTILEGLVDFPEQNRPAELRKRLRNKGVRFTNPTPTESDICAAQEIADNKKHKDLMRDHRDLDQGNILPSDAKRRVIINPTARSNSDANGNIMYKTSTEVASKSSGNTNAINNKTVVASTGTETGNVKIESTKKRPFSSVDEEEAEF